MSIFDSDSVALEAAFAEAGRFRILDQLCTGPGPTWRVWDRERGARLEAVELPITRSHSLPELMAMRAQLDNLAPGLVEQPLEYLELRGFRLALFEDRPWVSLQDWVSERGVFSEIGALNLMRWGAQTFFALERQGIRLRSQDPSALWIDGELGPDHLLLPSPLRDRYRFWRRSGLTTCGVMIGTPFYLAPEELRGYQDNPHAGQYHLGAWLFYALFGKPPFRGKTTIELFKKIIDAPLEIPQDRELSPGVGSLILRAMAKDPAERFASFGDLIEAIDALAGITDPALLRSLSEETGLDLREIRAGELDAHNPSFSARAGGQSLRVSLGLTPRGRFVIGAREKASRLPSEMPPPYPVIAAGALPTGVRFLVERDLNWPTLQSRLDDRGAIDSERLGTIAALALVSLADLHGQGWFHGNINPRTILRGPDGAVFLDKARYHTRRPLEPRDQAQLARQSSPYLAPELKSSGKPSVRADLFALGASLRAALPEDERGPLRVFLDRLAHPRAWLRPRSAMHALRQAKALALRRPA